MKNNAFTLIETMIVVVIIGILATIGLIKFDEFLQLGRERDAVAQLRAIATALKEYEMRAKAYPDGGDDLSNVDDINTNLGLSIMEHGMTYSCDDFPVTFIYDCHATSDAHSWVLSVSGDSGTGTFLDAHCSSGTCPTCDSCATCTNGDSSDANYCY
jgi:prepilin-type N-terminal cleavage/methylation domain-containing protein